MRGVNGSQAQATRQRANARRRMRWRLRRHRHTSPSTCCLRPPTRSRSHKTARPTKRTQVVLEFFKRHFSQSWRVAHTKVSRFNSVAITMALALASEQSSLYSESNIAKHHWDVRFLPFRSLALNRTSCTHSKIHCSRIHGCPPPWNV